MIRRKVSRRWIEPLDFLDVRRRADLTRKQAADVLDVTVRTIQNWETGGARIPWLAYRMLRILTGCALPGKVWEGWSVRGDRLYAPNGRWFDGNLLEQIEQVYAMARLWRQDYARRCAPLFAVVVPFPVISNRIKGAERSSEAPRPFPVVGRIGGRT
jgi:DNA-binding XRE family transcriptional regulator